MSVNDLKSRMSDIPGIDGLTMQLANGQQVFTIGDVMASTGAFASDDEIETAIRNAVRLPSVPLIAEETKDAPMSSVTGARSASTSLKQMMEEAKKSVADGMAEVQAGIEKHAKAGAALKNLGTTLNSDGDDLLASVGQFTNDLG